MPTVCHMNISEKDDFTTLIRHVGESVNLPYSFYQNWRQLCTPFYNRVSTEIIMVLFFNLHIIYFSMFCFATVQQSLMSLAHSFVFCSSYLMDRIPLTPNNIYFIIASGIFLRTSVIVTEHV